MKFSSSKYCFAKEEYPPNLFSNYNKNTNFMPPFTAPEQTNSSFRTSKKEQSLYRKPFVPRMRFLKFSAVLGTTSS